MAQTYRSIEISRDQTAGWAAIGLVAAGAAAAMIGTLVFGSSWPLLLAAAFAGGVLCGRQLNGLTQTFGIWQQTRRARKARRQNRRGGSHQPS